MEVDTPVASPDVPEFQTSPGTRDILPPQSTRFRELVRIFADVVGPAGYGEIIPPMFEDLGVFHRLGEATDVVSARSSRRATPAASVADQSGRRRVQVPDAAVVQQALTRTNPSDRKRARSTHEAARLKKLADRARKTE